jgi:hypothetical protein
MPNLSPIRIAIIGVDKFTAPLRLFNSQVRLTLKPLSDLGDHIGRFSKAAGFERLGSAFSRVGSSIGGVASAVGGLALKFGAIAGGAGAGLFALVNGTAEAGENLKNLAYVLGIPIDVLQQLQYAANMADIDMESFTTSMKFFGVNIAAAAANTGTALPAFKALGIQVKDIATGKTRASKDILLDLAAAMDKLGDPNMRNRIAKTVFGKTGIDMVKMLKGGRAELEKTMERAAQFGTFSEDSANKSALFSDSLKETKFALVGLRNVIGIELMPIFTQWMKKISDLIIVYKPQITAFAKKFAEGLPERVGKLIDSMKDLWEGLKPILKFFGDIFKLLGPTKSAMLLLGGAIAITLVPAVYSLVTAVGALGAVLLTTPIGWITLGIAALGAGVLALYLHYQDLKNAIQGPVKITTVEEAKKSSLKDLRDQYFRSLRATGTIAPTPEVTAAEEKVKSYGIELPDDMEQRVRMINDLYNQASRAVGTEGKRPKTPGRLAPVPGAAPGTPAGNYLFPDEAANMPDQKSKIDLNISFDNMPRGAKVTREFSGSPVNYNLDLGYATAGQ